MLKKVFSALLSAVFFFSCMFPVAADSADGAEGNMDGTGGSMGSADSNANIWHVGDDGVRVTVIEKSTRQAVGNSFDWTDITPASNLTSFVRRNKLQYLNGSSLAPNYASYVYRNPTAPLPTIISSGGTSNIANVKEYFMDEGRIRAIADDAGISYDTLTDPWGTHTILLEPIAFFTYNGDNYAMTATEAALYNRQLNGNLRAKMGDLTSLNLPLCMFLETSELGIPAGGGSGYQSNENIISYLGVGTINFNDGIDIESDPGGDMTFDYEYHTDTDVVTSILVTASGEINPDDPGQATFHIPGQPSITKEFVIPEDESQLVWIKWHTPEDPTQMEIPVELSAGSAADLTLSVNITELEENIPPNPEGRDLNDGFSLKSAPTAESVSVLTWGEWWAIWVDDEDSDDSDDGEWVFYWRSYEASLAVTAKIYPDDRVPTATSRGTQYIIKSGYGINTDVKVTMTTSGGADNTAEVQHISAVFPEFDFLTYNRLLEPSGGSPAYIETWHFKPNEYSQFVNPVHFTPIYYPDNKKYPVSFTVMDAWTPAGQLYYVLTADNITINGNVYQDWHIAPGFGSS